MLIRGRGDSAGAAGREREERERAGLCFFLRADDGEKKKKGGYGAGLSSFTAGVRRMTDWEGWLCLGEKEDPLILAHLMVWSLVLDRVK